MRYAKTWFYGSLCSVDITRLGCHCSVTQLNLNIHVSYIAGSGFHCSLAEPGIHGGATLLDIIFHGSVTQLNMAFLFCCTVEPGFHRCDTWRNLAFVAVTRLDLAFLALLDGWTWLSWFCYTAGPAFHGSVIRLNLAFTTLLHG